MYFCTFTPNRDIRGLLQGWRYLSYTKRSRTLMSQIHVQCFWSSTCLSLDAYISIWLLRSYEFVFVFVGDRIDRATL